jgi:hypothetical protein
MGGDVNKCSFFELSTMKSVKIWEDCMT